MEWTSEQRVRTLLGLRDRHVVTIGGGTGPFALLSTLKRHECDITAIVTMSDSGGSSRKLMDEFGTLPVGDLRQALVALSRKGVLWRDVFTYRFGNNGKTIGGGKPASGTVAFDQPGLAGHSLGNLIIAALQELNHGNLLHAIQDAQQLLDTAGRVAPVTLDHATLCAELENGELIESEERIDTRGVTDRGALSPIKRLFIKESAAACDEALRAIRRADVIVIGPGDLYTSILPNFVVEGVADAIRASDAQKVYVCNLMTKRGETDGYTASDFVRTLHGYLGGRVDRVVAHTGVFPDHLRERYESDNQYPVIPDLEALRDLVPEVVVEPLVSVYQDAFVRHDAERLLQAIFTPAEYLG